ncbi:cation transport ATPase [Legionella sainthelensi]|uniref:Cation transport ATPase n=1 Tax=Legionella sainthelensi TaxID=28087 RepID=A0A0W0YCB7_9GAMM|nr:HAD-IC family P-type ATPase [Legionella sainthelensi]KTD54586.1 cation transport ATPase [Legionella sainthelensi]VEH28713.1 cation transport ATPase [Legionella sainthelensi]
MYYNYRLYFSDDVQLLDPMKTKEKIEHILNETKELGLVRMAIDLDSQNKSISLLCKSKDALALQTKVTQLLLTENIAVGETIEKEALADEEEIVCEVPQHTSSTEHPVPIKKRKKKSKHNHSHHHAHGHCPDQCQNHSPDHNHAHSHGHTHDHVHGHENHWFKAALGLLWGIGLLALSIASFNIPMTAYYVITGLTTLMTLYLGRTVYQSAWEALREKKWDTSALYTISTLTIVAVSIISLFVPSLPMMFEAAPLVLAFWHLAEGIEHTLVDEINKNLDVRDCIAPLVLLKGNPDKEISVKKLIPNDIIIVKQGQVIPVDGVLTEKALLYTTRIDGSPQLKEFQPGDIVKAGMRLADHIPSLQMRVTKTYQNSYLSLIAKNINQANNEKAPIELFAERVLKYFIPGLLAVAAISGIVISTLFTPALAIHCLVSVLVSACPCALSLITPMAVKIGMKKASEQGIQFKNGKALQAAADIDTIVFDLNGTLTKGEVVVDTLRIDDKKFLRHIALLESQSDHPVAKIIKSYLHTQPVVSNEYLDISSIDKSHHSGIKGMINGETYMVGNKDMLLANGITQITKPYDNPENGSVYIVRGEKVIGQIALTDPLRDDAIATVNHLKRLGKTVHICTGADRATAERYASLLGVSKANICANTVGAITKPGEISKTSYIQKLKSKGYKVAMVGDAANDLTAIAYSNIGIAVRSDIGDTITQQHAGIVIQQGLLFPIATAFDVAQKTKDNIYQNLFVSLAYNSTITLVAAGLFVALGFTLNPAIGVALVVLESTIVLANLYRFKQQEIVSATSNSKNGVMDLEPSENTTSKVLNALGYRSQPKTNLAAAQKLDAINAQSRSLFAPQESYTKHSLTGAQQEVLCQI